jgi:hypothetical protein
MPLTVRRKSGSAEYPNTSTVSPTARSPNAAGWPSASKIEVCGPERTSTQRLRSDDLRGDRFADEARFGDHVFGAFDLVALEVLGQRGADQLHVLDVQSDLRPVAGRHVLRRAQRCASHSVHW